MGADVGFTSGALIDAASGLQDRYDPFIESLSSLSEEIAELIPGVNGSYVESLTGALQLWNDSVGVLCDDLFRFAEALVGVEQAFGACENEVVASLIQAGIGSQGGGNSSLFEAFAKELGGVGPGAASVGGGDSRSFAEVLGGAS